MLENPNLSGPSSSTPQYAGTARTSLRLVGATLKLASPDTLAPGDWLPSIAALLEWLEIRVEQAPPRAGQGLRDVVEWARGEPPASSPPLFAPWQAWSPVRYQQSGTPLPAGSAWAGSYLFDHGVGQSPHGARLDVLLMSPHPLSGLVAEESDAQLPKHALLERMISAARSESRRKVALVVHAGSRNAAIGQLLRARRLLTGDETEVDVVVIEEALVKLLRNPRRWDAIIVMPGLRSMVFALLSEAGDVPGPCPMLWHGRGLSAIGAEALENRSVPLPLDAPLLIQALVFALLNDGLLQAARRLYHAAAQLWLRGVATPGRNSVAPYASQVTDAEFIDLICKGAAVGGRIVADWRALGPIGLPTGAVSLPRLRVVTPD